MFQDFLEYSIFQKIQDFLCCKFFLEYDIIYIPHKKLHFEWKINFLIIPVIFHIPKISIFPLLKVFFGIFLEYSIFQIFQYFLVEGLFWNIPFLRFSYSMEYSVEYSMEYSILKLRYILRGRKVWSGFIVIFLERDIQRNNSFKFLTFQLVRSVLDYWGIDG